MPEDAIATLEAPAETAVEETTVDAGTEDTGAETTDETAEGDGGEETGEPAARTGDGKFLSDADKAILAEIKAKDPKLAARVRNALFASEAFKKAVPGGLKEVQQLRSQIEQVGGF